MSSIRLPNETRDRLLDIEGADTIARAVKLARIEIDKLP
jgi:hypothetical protein